MGLARSVAVASQMDGALRGGEGAQLSGVGEAVPLVVAGYRRLARPRAAAGAREGGARAPPQPDAAHSHRRAPQELAHYATETTDLEFRYPFGWGELWGIANRGRYDLDRHAEASGEELAVADPDDPSKVRAPLGAPAARSGWRDSVQHRP